MVIQTHFFVGYNLCVCFGFFSAVLEYPLHALMLTNDCSLFRLFFLFLLFWIESSGSS